MTVFRSVPIDWAVAAKIFKSTQKFHFFASTLSVFFSQESSLFWMVPTAVLFNCKRKSHWVRTYRPPRKNSIASTSQNLCEAALQKHSQGNCTSIVILHNDVRCGFAQEKLAQQRTLDKILTRLAFMEASSDGYRWQVVSGKFQPKRFHEKTRLLSFVRVCSKHQTNCWKPFHTKACLLLLAACCDHNARVVFVQWDRTTQKKKTIPVVFLRCPTCISVQKQRGFSIAASLGVKRP